MADNNYSILGSSIGSLVHTVSNKPVSNEGIVYRK